MLWGTRGSIWVDVMQGDTLPATLFFSASTFFSFFYSHPIRPTGCSHCMMECFWAFLTNLRIGVICESPTHYFKKRDKMLKLRRGFKDKRARPVAEATSRRLASKPAVHTRHQNEWKRGPQGSGSVTCFVELCDREVLGRRVSHWVRLHLSPFGITANRVERA